MMYGELDVAEELSDIKDESIGGDELVEYDDDDDDDEQDDEGREAAATAAA